MEWLESVRFVNSHDPGIQLIYNPQLSCAKQQEAADIELVAQEVAAKYAFNLPPLAHVPPGSSMEPFVQPPAVKTESPKQTAS